MDEGPKTYRSAGLAIGSRICFFAAFTLYVVGWIFIFLISELRSLGPGIEAIGALAYFCTVLPIGPAFLCLVGAALQIVRWLTGGASATKPIRVPWLVVSVLGGAVLGAFLASGSGVTYEAGSLNAIQRHLAAILGAMAGLLVGIVIDLNRRPVPIIRTSTLVAFGAICLALFAFLQLESGTMIAGMFLLLAAIAWNLR